MTNPVSHNLNIFLSRQPQIVWKPEDRRYAGFVQMHLPDAWGYIVFGGAVAGRETTTVESAEPTPRDPSWPARLAAMNIYYAQKKFYDQTGSYASNIEQLSELVDWAIVNPFRIEIKIEIRPTIATEEDSFLVTVAGNADGSVVTVTQDRYLRVETMRMLTGKKAK
jgi:hypothetical protein